MIRILCAFLLITLSANFAWTQTQPDSTLVISIPITSISDELVSSIRFLDGEYKPIIENDIHLRMANFALEIDSISSALEDVTKDLITQNTGVVYYSSLQIRWKDIEDRISTELDEIREASEELQAVEEDLVLIKSKWDATLEGLEENASEQLVEKINATNLSLDTANTKLIERINEILLIESSLLESRFKATDYQKSLSEESTMELTGLLKTNNDFIWKFNRDESNSLSKIDQELLFNLSKEDSLIFIQGNRDFFYTMLVVFIFSSLIMFWFRRKRDELKEKGVDTYEVGEFLIGKPILSGFMFAMFFGLFFIPTMPYLFYRFFSLVFVFPFLLLFKGVYMRVLRGGLFYLVGIFFMIDVLSIIYLGMTFRYVSLIESVMIAGFMFWFLRNRSSIKPSSNTSAVLFNFLNTVIPLHSMLIVVAIIANIIGYDYMAHVINNGVLVSVILIFLMSTGYFSIKVLWQLFLNTDFALKSHIVRNHKNWLMLKPLGYLWIIVVVAWVNYSLKAMLLLNPLKSWFWGVMETSYKFGNVEVTTGGVVFFFVILFLTWIISSAIKVFLRDEVMDRMDLPRGVPMAISSVTQYFLVTLGFLLAMAFAGFDISNLGLIAGALGVGIGFGLRDIVGDFVSGLILVFERPVTEGDTIKVAEHEGVVTNIGVRSSVLRRWDGSRIIIPNRDLISEKVLNWTLTKYQRRFTILVKTSIESDPEIVMSAMVDGAKQVSEVLSLPEPAAYFLGSVDNAFSFRMFYWASANILDCESEVNLAVQKSLKEQGVKIVVPIVIKKSDHSS